MKTLYIDIDGVLVVHGEPAAGTCEFLRFATENFECYWLSTHCDGDAAPAVRYLSARLPEDALPYLEKIRPTAWGSLRKTEGIDFSKEFFWIDDNLFEAEKQVLESKGLLDSFIHIDLSTNPKQLLDVIEVLKNEK